MKSNLCHHNDKLFVCSGTQKSGENNQRNCISGHRSYGCKALNNLGMPRLHFVFLKTLGYFVCWKTHSMQLFRSQMSLQNQNCFCWNCQWTVRSCKNHTYYCLPHNPFPLIRYIQLILPCSCHHHISHK